MWQTRARARSAPDLRCLGSRRRATGSGGSGFGRQAKQGHGDAAWRCGGGLTRRLWTTRATQHHLPGRRASGTAGRARLACFPSTVASAPHAQVEGWAGEFEPLQFEVVEKGEARRLWTELIERHHYLHYRVPVGANLCYLVRSSRKGAGVLACLSWSSPAWKMAARDEWIGWNGEKRTRNLQLIVNNSRFLVLPWLHVKGLASKILAYSARQVSIDWQARYGCRPLLLETLVDGQRFRGTCYRAANWIWVGQTQGRGRMDRQHKAHGQAVKNIYIYPLVRDARQRLCAD